MRITLSSFALLSAVALGLSACQPASPVPTGSHSSSSVSDKITGWKTVENPGGKYEIQMPSSWSGEIQSDGQYLLRYSDGGNGQTLQTYVASANGAANLAEYLKNLDVLRATGYEGQPSQEVKSTKRVSVDRTPGAERREYGLASGFEQAVTYVLKNDKVYTVSTWHEGNEYLTAEDIALHEKIAQTLKIK